MTKTMRAWRKANAYVRSGHHAKAAYWLSRHMLRHACGYALANAGHDTRALQAWLGHKNIQHTVRYTELAPDRFKSLSENIRRDYKVFGA